MFSYHIVLTNDRGSSKRNGNDISSIQGDTCPNEYINGIFTPPLSSSAKKGMKRSMKSIYSSFSSWATSAEVSSSSSEYQQLRKAGLCVTDSADPSIVSHLEQGKNQW